MAPTCHDLCQEVITASGTQKALVIISLRESIDPNFGKSERRRGRCKRRSR